MVYLTTRYATYGLQFINTLFIAHLLGPYYLGVWGAIMLILQYLNQLQFGVPNSMNTLLSVMKEKVWYKQKVIGTSFVMIIFLSIIMGVSITTLGMFGVLNNDRYNFDPFLFAIIIIASTGYLNGLMFRIYRVNNRYLEIGINQSAFIVLTSISLVIFREKELLFALLYSNLIAFVISLLIYIHRYPIKFEFVFDIRLFKKIQGKGIYLYLYNASFNLIFISTKTFVSSYYSILEFGNFTFAFSLANIILLLFNTLSAIIYPKLLRRIANDSNESIYDVLTKIKQVYITAVHFSTHLGILLLPLLLQFFPNYSASKESFNLIAIVISVQVMSFGYTGLLIAKGNEKKIALITLFSLTINLSICFVLASYLHLQFHNIVLATLFTFYLYNFLIFRAGRKLISLSTTWWKVMADLFNLKTAAPLFLSISISLMGFSHSFFVLPFLLFLTLNLKNFAAIINVVRSILSNPKFFNL